MQGSTLRRMSHNQHRRSQQYVIPAEVLIMQKLYMVTLVYCFKRGGRFVTIMYYILATSRSTVYLYLVAL